MTELPDIGDKDLLDELQRIIAERGVMLRTCRSGVKIDIGFSGDGPMYEFFGGPELGELGQGVGSYSNQFVERGDSASYLGGDIRALIKKAIVHDRRVDAGKKP